MQVVKSTCNIESIKSLFLLPADSRWTKETYGKMKKKTTKKMHNLFAIYPSTCTEIRHMPILRWPQQELCKTKQQLTLCKSGANAGS